MANKANGKVNKSDAIRELFRERPDIPVPELVSTLAGKGIEVTSSLVYYVKGNLKGETSRRKTVNRSATMMEASSGRHDALGTIKKIKALASEVGGLSKLKALVDALDA